jgi:hypothetical protein
VERTTDRTALRRTRRNHQLMRGDAHLVLITRSYRWKGDGQLTIPIVHRTVETAFTVCIEHLFNAGYSRPPTKS